MKKVLLSLLSASLLTGVCSAQTLRTTYEPVRYEDGTPVEVDGETEALFAQDTFLADTTFTEQGDTLLTFRHASAFVQLRLDGLPADSDIDRIILVPMHGEITELPVTVPESGTVDLWLANAPQRLPPTAAVAQGPDGRLWSVRLPAIDLKPGIAYPWTGNLLMQEELATDLQAKPLSQVLLDIEPGGYSGITHIGGPIYAVVDDNREGGGIVLFRIPIDGYGTVGQVSMPDLKGMGASTGEMRDCEGIAFVPERRSFFVSSEKHQEILEYDLRGRETGCYLEVPEDLGTSRIQYNRGFEALTYNPATALFWTTTESPLKKDTFLPRMLRLQSFDIDGNPAGRFLYRTEEPLVTDPSSAQAYVFGVPAMTALDDGRLIVLEREVYVPKGGILTKLRNAFSQMSLYVVDPAGDSAGILRKALLCSFRTGALDLANYEGMCLGPTFSDGRRCLVLIADSQNGSGGMVQEYVKVILLGKSAQ